MRITTQTKINVLNNGYVRLRDVMGDDRTVANAARVSFDKRTEELDEKDERLIAFLAREDHASPLRHALMQFEIYAPLMIARQWHKYEIGSNNSEFTAWNESSRRYITENEEFYVPAPSEWRSYADNVKQGSGDPVEDSLGEELTEALMTYIELGEKADNKSLEKGVAPEQARLFLPAYGMFARWYWTASLQSVAHLLRQRTAPDAQYEFRLYAEAVKELAFEKFSVSLGELLKERE